MMGWFCLGRGEARQELLRSAHSLPMLRMRLLIPLLMVAACTDGVQPGRPPRHVLLITVEGLRADHTSAMLYQRSTTLQSVTPQQRAEGKALSLDDLAADGVLFSQAFAPSGSAPQGVLSVLGGERGLQEQPTPMLAQAMLDAGMFTVAFVNDSNGLPAQVEQGFHACLRRESDLKVLVEAVRWFDVHDFGNDEGVFVWVHLAGPAFPFSPGSFIDLSTKQTVDFAGLYTDPDSDSKMTGSLEERDAWWAGRQSDSPSAADRERLIDLYDGGVAQMSFQVGYLLDYLQFATRSDQALDETVLVLAGVHGVELDRPGVPWGVSSEARDSSLRVPLVIRHPGGLRGSRILSPVVELCDLAPTLCEWFGAPAQQPKGEGSSAHKGRSLMPLLGSPFGVQESELSEAQKASSFGKHAALGIQTDPPRLTVRDGRWRLVVNLLESESNPGKIDSQSARLFDSGRDPREERDATAQHPEQVARLLQMLEDVQGTGLTRKGRKP